MSLPMSRQKHVLTALLLLSGYTLNLWLTNVLREQAHGIDTIWTANAFVIGAILLLPSRWSGACLAVGFIVQAATILLFRHALFDAVGYSLLNVVEAIAVVALARRLNVVRLTTPGRFAALVFLVLAPILTLFAGALGLVIMGMSGEFPVTAMLNRLVAKFLGMSVVLPAILLLARPARAAAPRGHLWEIAGSAALVTALTGMVFTDLGSAALLATFPALTLLGLRLGPRAVTLGMIMICGVLLTLGGIMGSPGLLSGDLSPSKQITAMQVYLAMVFATGIMAALMATHQLRLRALLTARADSDRRARERAEAASVAKTDFLATMSHEIRTPLNSILGFAQILDRRTDMPDAGRRDLELIQRSGDALLTVVNDILDFSKVEAGQVSLDAKPADLAGVCRDALGIVAETAERKGLSLAMTVEGETSSSHLCDDRRLCQVLLNYLNNAVKFTDAGAITLHLAMTPQGDGDCVRISVTDTGVGIPPKALKRLFQRFSQVDSSVSRTYGGTGLGLAICKGLIEAMGGQVGARSKVGEGSVFWLEMALPRCEAVSPADMAGGSDAPLSAHILLVDDHPMNRELGVAVLGLLGCTVDVACDGREGIEAASVGRYDAILMDVHMPVVDGLAASRAIRAFPGPAGKVPIIAMSADVLPEQQDRMRAAGMIDSVAKPVNIEDLHDCLQRWVGRDISGEVVAA